MKNTLSKAAQLLLVCSAVITAACNPVDVPSDVSTGSDSGTNTGTDTGSSSTTPMYAEILTAWIINDTNETAAVMAGNPLVNVQAITEETVNSVDYVTMDATGIPDYQLTVTQAHIDFLDQRVSDSPDDFKPLGAPNPPTLKGHTATLGQVLEFGESINWASNNNCVTYQGYGYWPPGPECPSDQSKSEKIPTQPVVDSAGDCEVAANSIGYAVNGVSIFSWTDDQSYNSEGSWQTIATLAEVYDVDLCGGHAQQQGNYHHHFYSSCWSEVVNDTTTATGHSPVYGFAADGYPVYGPWHANGVQAQSCWKVRDFTAGTGTGGGCADSARSCHLIDSTDPSQGTTTTGVHAGPAFDGSYTSLSGNVFVTPAGFFYEDYYYDSSCTSASTAALDKHNGHDHDGLGYHYHVTLDGPDADTASPAFPYTFGPTYRGELPAESSAVCNSQAGPPV